MIRKGFRVSAKTEPGEWRLITLSADGNIISCTCGAIIYCNQTENNAAMCSHIDATLIAGERGMVHTDDHILADQIAESMVKVPALPSAWKASWRKNLIWRGISRMGRRPGSYRPPKDRIPGRPIVCFTGKLDRPRATILAEAEQNGWETINTPSPSTDVLVAVDPIGNSAKLAAARANGTPIVTPEEWARLMLDGEIP